MNQNRNLVSSLDRHAPTRLAHLILPNARIISALRHPLDSCLGSYKQLFAKGQNFTHDMNERAQYYRKYHETMKHRHCMLPGKVLEADYEDTIGDFEAQVRQPLYTRAHGTWRRYEKHLGPWHEDLDDIIAGLPDSVRNAGF